MIGSKSRNDCHSERESYFAFCTVASACMAFLSNQSAKAAVANIYQERNNSEKVSKGRSAGYLCSRAAKRFFFFLRRLLVFVILLPPIRQQWKCRHERLSFRFPCPFRVNELGLSPECWCSWRFRDKVFLCIHRYIESKPSVT